MLSRLFGGSVQAEADREEAFEAREEPWPYRHAAAGNAVVQDRLTAAALKLRCKACPLDACREEDADSALAASSTKDTTGDARSPFELPSSFSRFTLQVETETPPPEVSESDYNQASPEEFRLVIRHTVSGSVIAEAWVRPSDSVARLCDEILRFLGETSGACLQLVYRGYTILEPRQTLEEAGVTAEEPELGAVLMPLRCLTASLDGTARIRHLHSGVQVMVDVGSRVWAAASPSGGSSLLTISTSGEGSLWCSETGVKLCTLKERILTCSFSVDGNRFVGASDDFAAAVWCSETGECLLTLTGHTEDIKAAVFSPDARSVVTASGDGTARIFEVESGRCLQTLSGHTDAVLCASFSPDGRLVLTSAMDGTARLWRVASGEPLQTLTGHAKAVDRASFAPCGTKVLTNSFDGSARLWDVDSGAELLVVRGEDGLVKFAALSPDGTRLFVAAGSESPRLHDAATGVPLVTFTGHSDWIRCASFSPDGLLLATASYDGTARIWNTLSGECVEVLEGHTGAVVAADFGFS